MDIVITSPPLYPSMPLLVDLSEYEKGRLLNLLPLVNGTSLGKTRREIAEALRLPLPKVRKLMDALGGRVCYSRKRWYRTS